MIKMTMRERKKLRMAIISIVLWYHQDIETILTHAPFLILPYWNHQSTFILVALILNWKWIDIIVFFQGSVRVRPFRVLRLSFEWIVNESDWSTSMFVFVNLFLFQMHLFVIMEFLLIFFIRNNSTYFSSPINIRSFFKKNSMSKTNAFILMKDSFFLWTLIKFCKRFDRFTNQRIRRKRKLCLFCQLTG